ncbi:hydroxyacid dehydrogenase [Cohnella hongkongensis]|uniref:Hydroxyacid dehydrogenase n=1 Tax=Cohnella hongkongensis TaxID=178337 RepID=A0ABV9F9Z9_9BACL
MKIVITELNWPIGMEMLRDKGWEVVYEPGLWNDRSRLREQLRTADAIIVRNQTQVDAELLDWEHRLKAIGRLGVGLDNLDLQAAAKKNIPVVFGKNANATSVAEYVISGIFAHGRLLNEAAASVRTGEWNRKRFTGFEVAGKTLGLIGIGEIGHRVAARARALGMKVCGYDPYVSPFDFPVAETGIELTSYARVVAESDFISLHVPLTAQTRNLMNRDAFGKMKPNAVLINSARGGIVNEADLNEALETGRIAGAVLDVLEQEPPAAEHPLFRRAECLITPHIAGLTEESQVRTASMVSAEIINELEGRVSLCRVRARN